MTRWTQTWLPGPGEDPEEGHAGRRLGLPQRGPGAAAGFGPRIGALVADWVPCLLLAQLLTSNPGLSTLVLFAVLRAVAVSIAARSPGHAIAGLRVARLDGRPAGFGPAVIRTVLLCLVIPPLLSDGDGRGLHDRAAGTVVLTTR